MSYLHNFFYQQKQNSMWNPIYVVLMTEPSTGENCKDEISHNC